jgi:hypothetical protein
MYQLPYVDRAAVTNTTYTTAGPRQAHACTFRRQRNNSTPDSAPALRGVGEEASAASRSVSHQSVICLSVIDTGRPTTSDLWAKTNLKGEHVGLAQHRQLRLAGFQKALKSERSVLRQPSLQRDQQR